MNRYSSFICCLFVSFFSISSIEMKRVVIDSGHKRGQKTKRIRLLPQQKEAQRHMEQAALQTECSHPRHHRSMHGCVMTERASGRHSAAFYVNTHWSILAWLWTHCCHYTEAWRWMINTADLRATERDAAVSYVLSLYATQVWRGF